MGRNRWEESEEEAEKIDAERREEKARWDRRKSKRDRDSFKKERRGRRNDFDEGGW